MKDLLEALQILVSHGADARNPFHCEHDKLYVWPGIGPARLSMDDRRRLVALGFAEQHECGQVTPCDLDESDERYASEYEDPTYRDECGKYCGWVSYRFGSC